MIYDANYLSTLYATDRNNCSTSLVRKKASAPNEPLMFSSVQLSSLRKLAHDIYRFYLKKVVKIENCQSHFFLIFLIFAQNTDCGYTLEPPRRFGSKIKK